MTVRHVPVLRQCRTRPRNGPPQTGPVPRSSRDARPRWRRHPPAAPRSHSRGVMSRPSSRMRRRAAQLHCPPTRWKTRIAPVTSVTARAESNRAPSPVVAQVGSSTKAYRPGSDGAPARTCRPYRAKHPLWWAGSLPFPGNQMKRGSSPGG